jgi:hypothetical protein
MEMMSAQSEEIAKRMPDFPETKTDAHHVTMRKDENSGK